MRSQDLYLNVLCKVAAIVSQVLNSTFFGHLFYPSVLFFPREYENSDIPPYSSPTEIKRRFAVSFSGTWPLLCGIQI